MTGQLWTWIVRTPYDEAYADRSSEHFETLGQVVAFLRLHKATLLGVQSGYREEGNICEFWSVVSYDADESLQ